MKKAYIKYISALLLFGSNGVVASHIALNSYEIVLSRALIGSLFLMAVFVISKQQLQCLKNKKDFAYIAISGIAMGASWMFLYEAYRQMGVSLATIAYYCGPVMVMILAPIVFQEKITRAKVLGFFAVFVGMFFVNYKELIQGQLSWGMLCGILSAVMYTIMVICNKKASSIKGLENAMCQLVMGFVIVCFFTLIKQGVTINVTSESIIPILILGIVNTGVGCYLYFSALPYLPAQSVAICGYLEPVSALIFSALLLHEQLTLIQLIGATLILGGAGFAELYKRRL